MLDRNVLITLTKAGSEDYQFVLVSGSVFGSKIKVMYLAGDDFAEAYNIPDKELMVGFAFSNAAIIIETLGLSNRLILRYYSPTLTYFTALASFKPLVAHKEFVDENLEELEPPKIPALNPGFGNAAVVRDPAIVYRNPPPSNYGNYDTIADVLESVLNLLQTSNVLVTNIEEVAEVDPITRLNSSISYVDFSASTNLPADIILIIANTQLFPVFGGSNLGLIRGFASRLVQFQRVTSKIRSTSLVNWSMYIFSSLFYTIDGYYSAFCELHSYITSPAPLMHLGYRAGAGANPDTVLTNAELGRLIAITTTLLRYLYDGTMSIGGSPGRFADLISRFLNPNDLVTKQVITIAYNNSLCNFFLSLSDIFQVFIGYVRDGVLPLTAGNQHLGVMLLLSYGMASFDSDFSVTINLVPKYINPECYLAIALLLSITE